YNVLPVLFYDSCRIRLLCVSLCLAVALSGSSPVLYGEVQLPGYPNPYPASLNEVWDLAVPQGFALQLTFRYLDIEPSQDCYYDSLTVMSGKKVLGRFCGQNSADENHPGNSPILSPSNRLRLLFQSDSSSPGPHQHIGFKAFYQAIDVDECASPVQEGEEPLCQHYCHNILGGYLCSCRHGYELQPNNRTCQLQCGGGVFTEPRGLISSPGYPNLSPPGLSCRYTIRVEPGFHITLHFLGLFDIEHQLSQCPHHWLKVSIPGHADLLLCGSEAPAPIVSSSNEVRLEYHTDQRGDSRGWRLEYTTERVQCPSPRSISHGRVTPQFLKYQFRDYIRVKCDTGYKLMMGEKEIGGYFSMCKSDGQWHLPLPECRIIDCGTPSNLLNGGVQFLSGSLNQYQSVIHYHCNEPYYVLERGAVVNYTCAADRKWTDSNSNYIIPTCFPVCGKPSASPSLTQRILGGQDAEEGAFPWQVFLNTFYGRAGAALIADRWILTAAHNVHSKKHSLQSLETIVESLEVYVGDNDVENILKNKLSVEAVFPHPGFSQSSTSFDNDLALIKLKEPVTVNRHIMPLCLPPEGTPYSPGSVGYVSGWGVTEEDTISNRLKFIRLPVVEQEKCRSSIESQRGRQRDIPTLTENMFCAGLPEGGKDTCQGDSGGAFTLQKGGSGGAFYAAGIVSWGIKCGEKGTYGVYTKVGNYLSWIKETMEKN
uniref:complement subcomponent C1r n=1 Tax=Lepisosteus oculatus TaxID=7918 RepID=W5MLB6_LEPOC